MNTDTDTASRVSSQRMKPKQKTFGQRLKERRGGRSQSEIAEKLGISIDTIQNWEQERYIPDDFKQKAVLAALD